MMSLFRNRFCRCRLLVLLYLVEEKSRGNAAADALRMCACASSFIYRLYKRTWWYHISSTNLHADDATNIDGKAGNILAILTN